MTASLKCKGVKVSSQKKCTFDVHPSPRNPKYQKWMPMESVNAECLVSRYALGSSEMCITKAMDWPFLRNEICGF